MYGLPSIRRRSSRSCQEGRVVPVLPYIVILLIVLQAVIVGCAPSESPITSAAGRSYRVGFLSAGEKQDWHVEFVLELGRKGYREGHNLTIEYRYASGQLSELPALAQELFDHGVDALLAADTPSAQAAKGVNAHKPIVLAIGADPVRDGLGESINRPGGNVTGLINRNTQLSGKRIELLQELVPGVARVTVVGQADNESHRHSVAETFDAAERLGVAIASDTYTSACDIPLLFKRAAEDSDALVLLAGPVLGRYSGWIALQAVENHLPVIYSHDVLVSAGGLTSYAVSQADLYRRAAGFMAGIFEGDKPAETPFEFANRLELSVNGRAANAIGLSLSPALLGRVDHVLDVDWGGQAPPGCTG
jgi:putative tryptophan/tyrosine transport system substrate-binding protein